MRALAAVVLAVGLWLVVVGATTTEPIQGERATTTSTPETTSTTLTVEISVSESVPVDYANPVRLEIPLQHIAAEIDWTGSAFGLNRFNPTKGRLDWWLDEETSGPCENGPVFILGHVTRIFRNLVDDPDVGDDYGVYEGDVILVELADDTMCEYRVVKFESEFGEEVVGTPARRFDKDDWARHDWANVIQENGSEPSLFLITSGGIVFETVNGSRHRVNADVVKAILERIIPPDRR